MIVGVIGWGEFETGVLAGAALILLGLVPGLFQGFATGILNAGFLLTSQYPGSSDWIKGYERPVWLAGLGTAIIMATALAFFAD